MIPEGLAHLIECDRASFNEVNVAADRKQIVPTPVPAAWHRFGAVYQDHLLDHPLWNPQSAPRLHRAVGLGDKSHVAQWSKSSLCREYFHPLGMRHQISSLISRRNSHYVGLAVNRTGRDFIRDDRFLLELVSAHVGQAWTNASELALLRQRSETTLKPCATNSAIIAVDAGRGAIQALSSRAAEILRNHFGTDSAGNDQLPDDFRRWLRAQRERLLKGDNLGEWLPIPFVVRTENECLTARLAQRTHEEVIVLLDVEAHAPRARDFHEDTLTLREIEILNWLREGKRNREIGIILGISARTVGKHLEHLFQKLGVETRTAAVRMAFDHPAFELRRSLDA